jgi:hypothetical protein
MRPTRLPARYMAGPIRWSCAGNNPTRPNASEWCRNCPDETLPEPLSCHRSSAYASRYCVPVNVPGDREPTISACAQIKSP